MAALLLCVSAVLCFCFGPGRDTTSWVARRFNFRPTI